MRSKTAAGICSVCLEAYEAISGLFAALPADAQRQARDAYRHFKQNPRHPSLQFKRISPADPSLYSARVGNHYRVVGKLKGDVVTWDWIGSHEAYNNLIQ